MTKQRIALISLVGILVFGLLLGGKLFYDNKWINDTLTKESQGIQGVTSVEVKSKDDLSELLIQTADVENLQQLSANLQGIAGKNLIKLLDQRTPELEDIYQEMQFPIQEAIMTGNFTVMDEKVKELASQAGVQVKLTMDSKAIYLTLEKGDHQLVSVLERQGQGVFLPSEARQ